MKKRLKPVELLLSIGLAAILMACGNSSSEIIEAANEAASGEVSEEGEGEEGEGEEGEGEEGEGEEGEGEEGEGEEGEGEEGEGEGEEGEGEEGEGEEGEGEEGEGEEGGGEEGGGEGGEGEGEGEEGGESAVSSSDVEYMTALALMRGHMIVAQELVEKKDYDEAARHISHLVEELEGDIESQLAERNITDMKANFEQLLEVAQSEPESPEMDEKFQSATASIDQAIAVIPESQRKSPDFVLEVLVRSLDAAAESYKAAIADNKFIAVVEYQDARGIVLYANRLYKTIAPDMSKTRVEEHTAITRTLSTLQEVWPSIDPPATPVKTPEEVDGLVFVIKASS